MDNEEPDNEELGNEEHGNEVLDMDTTELLAR